MKQILSWALCSFLLFSCQENTSKENISEDTTETKTPSPAEFADAKFTDIGKKSVASLASGDIDGWVSAYADNAVYMFNSGDSIAGKENITKYWKDRRMNVIDSLTFSNEIWLPIMVNQPQAREQAGVWLLSWQTIDVKYKTGKKIWQLTHIAMHFDANDKIDRVIHYLDRAPIAAATKN